MALSDVIAAINTELATVDSTITPKFGAENIMAEDAPRRVVWVPTNEEYEAAESHGGQEPRVLFTRLCSVDAHIWGAGNSNAALNFDDAEDALQKVITAIHRAAWGSFEMVSGRWEGQDGPNVQAGRVYVLSLRFRVPAVLKAQPWTTVVINGMPTTDEMVFPDASVEDVNVT